MTQSQILSRLSRLGLLSMLCTGLFLATGELSMSADGVVQIGNGGIQSAMAANQNSTDATNATINSIISFLNLGIGVLTFLITPLIMLAGWLLSPDWTFGEIFGLRPILHQLWILVSNVVYVIFGFLLVFIAFANIFGGESSKAYEMKSMLPKLVTGMLIVPFTWFIVSAVLSVSNILTASVISLPMDTILKAGGTNDLFSEPIIPKNIIYYKGQDFSSSDSDTMKGNGEFTASDCQKDSSGCLSIKDFLTNGGGGAYNLLSVYAYGIFKIQGYKAITPEQNINKVIDIASKLGFGVIFFIIFGILVIAIVYALFSRALMLWLYAMFSPLFVLNYVLESKNKSLEKFTIKKFISLAMVPVYVSAALAFGLMFLGLVMGATGTVEKTGGTEGILESDTVSIETVGKGKDSTTTFTFGDITFTSIGLLDSETKSGTSKALDIGKGIIGTIIINILALVILWMAVMAVLGVNEITEAAVAPIKKFGGEIGKLAINTPQYVPIPLPGGKSTSMAGVHNIGSGMHDRIRNMAMGDSTEIGQKFGETLGGVMGLKIGEVTKAIGKIDNASAKVDYTKYHNPQEKAQQVQNVIKSGGMDIKMVMEHQLARNRVIDEIKKAYNLDEKDLSALRNAGNKDQFDAAFRYLARKNNGLDFLVDKAEGVNEKDSFSSIFTGTEVTSGITITDKTATNIIINGESATITQVDTKVPFAANVEMTITRKEFNRLITKTGLKAEELEKELKSKNISIT